MTAYAGPPNDTAASLFRRHLREMENYAGEIENVLGAKNPIVSRIRSCAASNRFALDAVLQRQTSEKPAPRYCSCCGSKAQ